MDVRNIDLVLTFHTSALPIPKHIVVHSPDCCKCNHGVIEGISNTPGFKDDREGKDCQAKVQDDAGNAFQNRSRR